MLMSKWKCFALTVLILAVMLFLFAGCSGMETDPALPVPIPGPEAEENPEATPIEIPGPETEESSEDEESPEATPIEIPAEPDSEEEPVPTSD